MSQPLRIHLLPRALGALVLLTALLLGAVGHGWHHFVDHDCDAASTSSHHACVQCSSLHAATEAAEAEVAIAASPEPLGLVYAAHEAARSVHASAPRSARAPPLA